MGKGPQQGSQRGQKRQDEKQTSHGKNIKARNSGGSQKSREKRLSPRVGGQYYQIINLEAKKGEGEGNTHQTE